ncbi:MAG: DUF6090 family protein [Balneola sp.]
MLRFFRNIRQKLIEQENVRKYLLYAIGEIFLVVIGILIALQVNNWNQEKKEKRSEIQLLTEVVGNMETDLKNLDLKINETKRFLKSNEAVLNHLKTGGELTDSLRYHYAWLYGHGNFQPSLIAFENLKSIGIDIIKNDDVRVAISELYGFKYYFFVEDRREVVSSIQETLSNELLAHRRIITSYLEAEPINFTSLRKDVEFQNAINTYIFVLKWTINRYQEGQKEIELVKDMVNDYLNTLN